LAVGVGNLGERVALTLDTYEVFRFLDVWLRELFLPSVPPNVRVVLCGREPPVADWLMSGQWDRTSFGSLPLQGITDDEAFALLENIGVDAPAARRINRLAHGNPLARRTSAHPGSSKDRAATSRRRRKLRGPQLEPSRCW
jgi:hypothetical protein